MCSGRDYRGGAFAVTPVIMVNVFGCLELAS